MAWYWWGLMISVAVAAVTEYGLRKKGTGAPKFLVIAYMGNWIIAYASIAGILSSLLGSRLLALLLAILVTAVFVYIQVNIFD